MTTGSARSVRVTFRGQVAALVKLFAIARQNEWMNAAGDPNLSAAVTYLIEQYDEDKIDRSLRDKAQRDAVKYLTAKGNGKR